MVMERERFNRTKALKESANVSYLGSSRQSAKLEYSYEAGWETYGIYLAPYTMARDEKHPHINLCPKSDSCRDFCLNGSGHNKVEMLRNKDFTGLTKIDKARIRRTHLFYDNRKLFMKILIGEMKRHMNHALKNGLNFAVRLNCTSDLSPELFKDETGMNILQMFPHIQFYDYTKVVSRLKLQEKYANYDLVYSYDGTPESEKVAKEYLAKGGKVAIVFDIADENGKQTLPETYWGTKVIDANHSDTRFLDEPGTIMGLHYHRVGKDYVGGKYTPRETKFVVRSL